MTEIVKTSAFKSGNSVAVRLPKSFGVKPGDAVEISRQGADLVIRPALDLDRERADLAELAGILRALGPSDQFRGREEIELPDRAGLY